jgi:hypothetical protein
MEPFTALALATSIVQIIDFGAKLIGSGHQIYKNGSIASFEQAKCAAGDLQDITRSLASDLDKVSTSDCSVSISSDEERVSFKIRRLISSH